MVNLKSKSDRHALDNEKRRKSLKEKEKAKLNQSQVIKEALSTSALSSSFGKKIVFSEGDDSDNETSNIVKSNNKDKTALFDDSRSEEDFEIREKTQFGGKKGFELLNLQSTYGNDERFKIDERFLDEKEEKKEVQENELEGSENDVGVERIKQLKILESVLGEPVIEACGSEKKAKKRIHEMIRYDVTNKEHEKYEIKVKANSKNLMKKRKKVEKLLEKELPRAEVSKEKFFEVSSEIKNSFKESGQFSLLQTYGGNDNDIGDDSHVQNNNQTEDEEETKEEEIYETENNVEVSGNKTSKDKILIKGKNQMERELRNEAKGVTAKGIWKESFFFHSDDPRFKEGLEFINKKDSEEATEVAESYDKTRKRLKEILRLHMKKQLHKKDPFKNKIGGMSKKQKANFKFKNHKNNYSKKNFR